jgi:hypothetical protein
VTELVVVQLAGGATPKGRTTAPSTSPVRGQVNFGWFETRKLDQMRGKFKEG